MLMMKPPLFCDIFGFTQFTVFLSAVCSLQSVVCSMQSANVHHTPSLADPHLIQAIL